MSKHTHYQIQQAINAILTKGGQNLYQKYLNEKLPSDCNQKILSNIEQKFNVMNKQQPMQNRIARQHMPKAAHVDRVTPNKVVVRSKSSFQITKKMPNNFFNTQIPQSSEQKPKYSSNKPNFCVKFSCAKGQPQFNQDKMRIQKKQKDKQQKNTAENNQNNKQKSKFQRQNLQTKIKQLLVQGIPYTYDQQGNLDIPDIKNYKKELENSNKKAKNYPNIGPFSLKYKAIEYLSQGSVIKQSSQLSGRKKGFSQAITNRNKKINDEQFSNKHQRQYSTIPFMDISDGIKIVQRQRNIMAQKQQKRHISRLQFKQHSQKSLFKSYTYRSLNDQDDRPATHSHNRQQISQGSMRTSLALSVNSRPKTCKQFHRVYVANKDLAVQLVKEDELMARKLFI